MTTLKVMRQVGERQMGSRLLRLSCFFLLATAVGSEPAAAQPPSTSWGAPEDDQPPTMLDTPSSADGDNLALTAPALSSCGEFCDDSYGALSQTTGCFDELTFFFGVEGSKQPQDFGVNAHLGGQASMNWGIPLVGQYGIGAQIGTGVTSTANAVQVFELLGETTGRTQSYTTVGLFQRTGQGFAWGFAHDFLYQNYYDEFQLGQWRVRGAYDFTSSDQAGVTTMLGSRSDTGLFGAGTQVTLKPIDQGHVYWRHFWKTGAQTTAWFGIAEGHGEENIVTGPSAAKDEQFLFGADVLMPLSANLAIFGQTNMIMPSDTGTVDAFLGIQWYPGGNAFTARRGRFSPLMTLASPVSFAVDLLR